MFIALLEYRSICLHGENLLSKHYPKFEKNGVIETFGESLNNFARLLKNKF